jgi:DNA repair protein RadC
MKGSEVPHGKVLVEPRDVFPPAITEGAALIVIAHNHPSGNPEPSEQDLLLTQELHLAGRVVSIEVLDHIIIRVLHNSPLRHGL